jgi:hypothetical protein
MPLKFDEQILASAEELASQRGITLRQLLAELVDEARHLRESKSAMKSWVFSSMNLLADQVVEDILRTREERFLRIPSG